MHIDLGHLIVELEQPIDRAGAGANIGGLPCNLVVFIGWVTN